MSREEIELAQRQRHTRFLLRLALVSAGAVLLMAVGLAQSSLRALDVPLGLALLLSIGVATVASGWFVARSRLSDRTLMSGIAAAVVAAIVCIVLAFLALMVYLFFGGGIH